MPNQRLLAVLLILSLAGSVRLLWILNRQYKPIYGPILAWQLIFVGYVLLLVETLIGVLLVMNWLPVYTRFFNVGFCAIMLAKVICYDIGFDLWARKRHSLLDPKRWEHSRKGDN